MGVGFVAGGLPISVCTTCTCNAHSTNFVGRKVGAMWPCGLCPVSFLQSAVSRDGEFDKMENACVGLAWYPVERRNADAVTIIIIVEKSPKELNNLTREIGLFSVYFFGLQGNYGTGARESIALWCCVTKPRSEFNYRSVDRKIWAAFLNRLKVIGLSSKRQVDSGPIARE